MRLEGCNGRKLGGQGSAVITVMAIHSALPEGGLPAKPWSLSSTSSSFFPHNLCLSFAKPSAYVLTFHCALLHICLRQIRPVPVPVPIACHHAIHPQLQFLGGLRKDVEDLMLEVGYM